MKINSLYIVSLSSFLLLSSCKQEGPQPAGMVGLYEVSVRLKDGVIDKKSIRNEINAAMDKAEDEILKAKYELESDIDLASVDTATIEGKIEYAAKTFGKSMAEVGIEMGDLGKDLGEAISGLAVNSLDYSEDLLKNIKLHVELQEDGKINSKKSLLNLGLADARWEVKGDDFLFTNDNGQQPEVMKIARKNKDGFTLEKDDVFIDFVRKVQ